MEDEKVTIDANHPLAGVTLNFDVEIVGPIFGNEIWAPYANVFDYKKVEGRDFPGFFKSMIKMLKIIEGDIIYASNLKLSSYSVAVIKKLMSDGKSIMVDISDWHLGHSLNKSVRSIYKEAFYSVTKPNSFIYLLLMEYLIRYSDEVTLVSKFLQKRFGGTYLPQFVDTNVYDPKKFDRDDLREKWNVGENKVISFIGTPRSHKGIEELIQAVNMLDDEYNVKIMMTGNKNDPYVKYLLSMGGEKIMFLGYIPRKDEPMYLSMSDLIVLPQRLSYFSIAQVPIKAMAAMSMEKPIIASKVSDLPEILSGCGILVNPGDEADPGMKIS